jgi:hypothetical protein
VEPVANRRIFSAPLGLSVAAHLQKRLKRATETFGPFPFAMPLSDFDQQCMKLIKNLIIRRQVLVQKALRCGVAVLFRYHAMPRKDTPRIGIGHKERHPASVKQNSVRCFRAKSSKGQQLRSCRFRRLSEKRIEGSLMHSIKPLDECPNGAGFLPEVPCRSNAMLNLLDGRLPQSGPSQQTSFSQTHHGPGSILPRCVLGKDCAEDDLQASACRPPTLGAELPKEHFVVRYQHFTRLNSKRLSRALHSLELNTAITGKSSSAADFR